MMPRVYGQEASRAIGHVVGRAGGEGPVSPAFR